MRFWHWEAVVPNFDYDGFLADPESEYGHFFEQKCSSILFRQESSHITWRARSGKSKQSTGFIGLTRKREAMR